MSPVPFAWAPDAVAHFRPRGSLKSFFKQYYRYARGDGKADLWRKKHLIRYVTYLIALPGLLALSLLHSPGWWFVLLAGVMFYCATPYRRLQAHPAAPCIRRTCQSCAAAPRDSRGRRCGEDAGLSGGLGLAAAELGKGGDSLAENFPESGLVEQLLRAL